MTNQISIVLSWVMAPIVTSFIALVVGGVKMWTEVRELTKSVQLDRDNLKEHQVEDTKQFERMQVKLEKIETRLNGQDVILAGIHSDTQYIKEAMGRRP